MKILIVGAGISGLSSYLFLQKHLPPSSSSSSSQPHHITLVEAYDTTKLPRHTTNLAALLRAHDRRPVAADGEADHDPDFSAAIVGSALGLSSNGLAVLRRIGPEGEGVGDTTTTKTLDRIVARGHLVTKWALNAARGWRLAEIDLVPKTQRGASKGGPVVGDDGKDSASAAHDTSGNGGSSSSSSSSQLGVGVGPGLMIVRHALWECLRDAVVEAGGEVLRKKVVDLVVLDDLHTDDAHSTGHDGQQGGGGGGVRVSFADGTSDLVDLVIGADGLKSVVRRVMFQEEKDREGGTDYITPKYEGLAGIGGWVPASVLAATPLQPGVMSMTFGPTGFFGCGYMSSLPPDGVGGWWSTYPSASPPDPTTFDKADAIAAVLARHGGWRNPEIRAVCAHLRAAQAAGRPEEEAGLLDAVYATYTSPPLPAYTAKAGRLVLVGDAAHALQTSSGQALEDAEAYARLLARFLRPDEREGEAPLGDGWSMVAAALSEAGESYTALRRPRVQAIYERSQKMGGMKKTSSVVVEFLVYFAVWLMSFFPDKYNEQLMTYDVPTEVDKIIKERRHASASASSSP